MTSTSMPLPSAEPAARVTRAGGVVTVRDERLFEAGRDRLVERFLDRVFRVEDVRSVAIDRTKNVAAIRHCATPRGEGVFLEKLAGALRQDSHAGPAPGLPRAVREAVCTIHRHKRLLSSCQVLFDRPGRLRLRHDALDRDKTLVTQLEPALREAPGEIRVEFGSWTGSLLIIYEPSSVGVARLIRRVEDVLDAPGGWSRSLPGPNRTRYALENTNLGIAALADFAVSALAPVSAVLLVGANLRTFRAAGLQLVRRRLGLPVLYSAIVAATLASGQFVASALMTWFFKFWHGRLRIELASERRRLLDDCLPLPRLARLRTPDGLEVLVPIDRLRAGDRIEVGPDDAVPADGRVLEGEGIVDERSIRGLSGASRKRAGDLILAGSRVLAGALRVEVMRAGDRSRASSVVRALIAATTPAAGPLAPTQSAEAFADRAVGPTLATAGLGLLVGDLSTAGAILRPDYATGPGLAVSLETLRDVVLCAHSGIIVRAADVFDRLASVDRIVIDDDDIRRRTALEVVDIQTRLPEDELLRHAASAFRHLDDERSRALVDTCRARRIHLLDLPPAAFSPGVTVARGGRAIRVREHAPGFGDAGPLAVDVDETLVGLIHFGRSERKVAAAAFARIRDDASIPITLVSSRPETEVGRLAAELGVDDLRCGFSRADTARFLQDLRDQGVRAAYVGDGRARSLATLAHIAVSFGDEADLDAHPAAVVLLQPDPDLLADLWEISRMHRARAAEVRGIVAVPNVFCVAGALLFGFSGLTAVMISNLGTLALYRRAVGSLRALAPSNLGTSRTVAGGSRA